jgi:hypothetical protein
MTAHIISTKFSEKSLTEMTAIPITDGMRQLMQSPVDAFYRIDVESDSTVRADLTRQKADMTEFMTATSGFFSSMAPVVAQAPEIAEPLSEVYAAMSRFFKLGKGAEDALDRMTAIAKKAASTPKPNPEAERAKAEMEKAKAELQIRNKEVDGKLEVERGKLKLDQMKAIGEHLNRQDDTSLRRKDHELRVTEAGARRLEDGSLEGAGDRQESMVMQALQAIAQGQMQQGEAMMQGMAQLAQGNQMIAAAVTAPKKTEFVIDPATGKPIGAIQTPMVN